MGLTAERPLHCADYRCESGRMGRVGESVEEGLAFLGGEIELTGTAISDVNGDDAGDFFTEGLDGDFDR